MGKIQRAELAWLLYDPVVELLPPFVLLFLELCEKLLSDWRMDGEQCLVHGQPKKCMNESHVAAIII